MNTTKYKCSSQFSSAKYSVLLSREPNRTSPVDVRIPRHLFISFLFFSWKLLNS